MSYVEEVRDELKKRKDPVVEAAQGADEAARAFENDPLTPPLGGDPMSKSGVGGSYASMTSPSSDARRGAVMQNPGDYSRSDVARVQAGGAAPAMGSNVFGPPSPPSMPPVGDVVRARPMPGAGGAQGVPGVGGPAPMSPYLNDLRSQFEAEQRGVQGQAAGERGANDVAALGARRVGAEASNYGNAERRAGQDQEGDARRQQFEIDSLSRDLAGSKEDPNRWARSKTTGEKVAYTVASFLGGLSAGWNHTPNQVVEEINHSIDRDLAEQHSEIETKKGRLADMRGALAESYRRYGIGQDSRLKAHLASLDAVNAQTQSEAALANNPIVQAKADQLSAQIGQKKDEIMLRATAAKGGPDARSMILKRTQDIRDKSGGAISIDDARKQATAEILGQSGVAGGYAKGEAGGVTAGPAPASTAWDPRRYFQGTDAGHALLDQQQYNADVMGYAHKAYGARTPEAQREIMGGFIIQPGDSTETIRRKHEAFAAKVAHGGGAGAGPAGLPDGSDVLDEGGR